MVQVDTGLATAFFLDGNPDAAFGAIEVNGPLGQHGPLVFPAVLDFEQGIFIAAVAIRA